MCKIITQIPVGIQFRGQLSVTFEKNNGKISQWLVENDVDYIKQ